MDQREALRILTAETGIPEEAARKLTEQCGTIELDWDGLANIVEFVCELTHSDARAWVDCLKPDDHTDHSDKRVCQGVGCPHGDH